MSTANASLSDLINKPRATLAPLVGSFVHRIRLRRRDEVDLVLTTEDRYDQEQTVVRTAARLLHALVNHGEPAADLLGQVLLEVFPWAKYLPDADRAAFLADLVGDLRAMEDFDNLGPVAQMLIEWQHTAEVWADPEILSVLQREIDEVATEVVPRPNMAA